MTAVLGLSTYRWNNNIKSALLLLAFPLLLLLLLGVIFYVFGLIYASEPQAGGRLGAYMFRSFHLDFRGEGSPLDFATAAMIAYWPVVAGVAAVWTLIGYAFNDALIRAATGAKPVSRQEAPKLYNLLENLCISRGMKMPALHIIENSDLNAFASGLDESSYAITVTRALTEQLDDKELEAVLAHELTHIINRDVRLLIVTIVFTGMISFMAQMLWRSMRFAAYGRGRGRRGGGGAGVLILIAAVAMVIGYLLALGLRFALSRKREYMADAGAVELTKNPEAMIGALRKIAANPEVMHAPSEVKQMFIENPPSAMDFFGLFATHPPIEDRIRVLRQLGGLPAEGKSMLPPSG